MLTNEPTDRFTNKIHKRVEEINEGEMGDNYMKYAYEMRQARNEGYEEGYEEGILIGRLIGKLIRKEIEKLIREAEGELTDEKVGIIIGETRSKFSIISKLIPLMIDKEISNVVDEPIKVISNMRKIENIQRK